jgi:hypothetical protein
MRIDFKQDVTRVDIENGRYMCIVALDSKLDNKDGEMQFIGVLDDESGFDHDKGQEYYQEDFERLTRQAIKNFKRNRKFYDDNILDALSEQGLYAERIQFNETLITYSTNSVDK